MWATRIVVHLTLRNKHPKFLLLFVLCQGEYPVDIRSVRNLISQELRDFGIWKTIYDLSYRTVNQVVPFAIWHALVVDQPHPDFLRLPETFQGRLLGADAMSAYAGPENNLDEQMLEEARAKGDQCMALFNGGTLAAYGWYSSQPTDISDDLRLCFKNKYVYMYKGFTNNKFRGQRLHAIGMTLALQEYLRRGFLGMVSIVESRNFGSRKSGYRMGYHEFGRVYVLKALGRYFLHHTKSCREFEFSFQPKSATEAPKLKLENTVA
jgi:hypothetical protein